MSDAEKMIEMVRECCEDRLWYLHSAETLRGPGGGMIRCFVRFPCHQPAYWANHYPVVGLSDQQYLNKVIFEIVRYINDRYSRTS